MIYDHRSMLTNIGNNLYTNNTTNSINVTNTNINTRDTKLNSNKLFQSLPLNPLNKEKKVQE